MAGRPTIFSDELAARILERLADGESLRSIASDEAMPARSTIFKWVAENKNFETQYRMARDAQAEALFDELLDIADNGTNDWMERKYAEDANLGWRENGEAIRRSVLRVDARKWAISKMLPKKYGDRVTSVVEGGDKPVAVESAKPRELAKAIALVLAKGMKAGNGSGA